MTQAQVDVTPLVQTHVAAQALMEVSQAPVDATHNTLETAQVAQTAHIAPVVEVTDAVQIVATTDQQPAISADIV